MYRIVVLLFAVLMISQPARADEPQIIEIEVTGMTCPFCVYGTEKKLNQLPGVDKAEVSLKAKKARIVMTAGETADLDAIREAITNAGFTPGEITVDTAQDADSKDAQ